MSDVELRNVVGRSVYSNDSEKIGKAGQVFLDDETDRPAWVTVNTGLFGTSESFVPLQGASFADDELRVPYSKDQVKNAPNIEIEGGHMDVSEERRLYEYYGASLR